MLYSRGGGRLSVSHSVSLAREEWLCTCSPPCSHTTPIAGMRARFAASRRSLHLSGILKPISIEEVQRASLPQHIVSRAQELEAAVSVPNVERHRLNSWDMQSIRPVQQLIGLSTTCKGCSPLSAEAIKSYWDEETRGCWAKLPDPAAPSVPYIPDSRTKTLIICHCCCTAIASDYRRRGLAVGEGAPDQTTWEDPGFCSWSPSDDAPAPTSVTVLSNVVEVSGRKSTVHYSLYEGDSQRRLGGGQVVTVQGQPALSPRDVPSIVPRCPLAL
eukprot:Sspe_Gene.97131::Locus_70777_Transcript_1_2_Confidence_0.667_Length_1142::g.97131::m.97131